VVYVLQSYGTRVLAIPLAVRASVSRLATDGSSRFEELSVEGCGWLLGLPMAKRLLLPVIHGGWDIDVATKRVKVLEQRESMHLTQFKMDTVARSLAIGIIM